MHSCRLSSNGQDRAISYILFLCNVFTVYLLLFYSVCVIVWLPKNVFRKPALAPTLFCFNAHVEVFACTARDIFVNIHCSLHTKV